MKMRFILFGLLLFFCSSLFSQIRKIPSEVTVAMTERYPHAEKISWRDNISSFRAEYFLNGVEMKSDFTSKGEWIASEKKIEFETLPENVLNGFSKSKYTDWTKGNVAEITRQGKPLQYRIYVRKNAVEKKYLYFNADGVLVREAITL